MSDSRLTALRAACSSPPEHPSPESTRAAGQQVMDAMLDDFLTTVNHLIKAISTYTTGIEIGICSLLSWWAYIGALIRMAPDGRKIAVPVMVGMGLPVPLLRCAPGSTMPTAVPEGWAISALNDQHAYLRTGDAPHGLQVGERIALGISHPCTTFDKWRWMPVVDEACNVVDAIITCF